MGKTKVETRMTILSLGAFTGLCVVGQLGICAYMACYIDNNGPWLTYEPGRRGILGDLSYVICIVSIIDLAVFLVCLFFILCKCCKCLKKIFMIAGVVIWLAVFICECLFISWNGWDLNKKVKEEMNTDWFKEYSAAFAVKPQFAYFAIVNIPALGHMTTKSFPTFGTGDVLINYTDPDTSAVTVRQFTLPIPVCYFETKDDKDHFKEKECIGKWDGGKIKDFIQKLDEAEKDAKEREGWTDEKKEKWKFFNDLKTLVMYTHTGAYGIVPIFLGVQIFALAFGIIYVVLKLCSCCSCCKKTAKVAAGLP